MNPRKLSLAIALALLSVVVGAAQEEAPPSSEIPEFGVGTELVRIDVVVTDENDRPISGLTADDFVILEDGEPQELAHFEVYRRSLQLVTPGSEDPEPVVTDSGEEVEGYRRRHIVFAVDDLHIDPGNLSMAKDAMQRFVDEEIGPQDRVAIVATSGSTGLYQGFTNDPWELGLAIARLSPKIVRTSWAAVPQISEYQAELIDRGDPLALDLAVQEILAQEPPGASVVLAQNQARIRARAVRNETVQYVRTSLETLDHVMRGLAELPGRKVIVLVSDGFLMGLGTSNSQSFDMRRITDAGTRAGVVLYALDTRGLTGAPLAGDASQRAGPNARAPGVRERIRMENQEAVRDGMSGLAKDTGGFLVYNTNDYWRGLTRILEDTETYFLLAYQPTNTERDGRFRKIEVRLPGRDDFEVRTRRGYFAPDENEESEPIAPEEAGQRVANELHEALASLYARTAIPLRLSADFVSLGSAGPQLVVNANVDLAAVPFERVGGRHVAALVLAGVVYDAGGAPFKSLEPQRIDLRLERPDYEQARKVGMKYNKALSLKPGAYEVRFAVRDEGSGMLGSASQWIEIPDVEGGRLTLSDVFLLRGAAAVTTEEADDPAPEPQLTEVQAFPRFERTDSLVYQLQVLNPNTDASGDTDLTIQVQILEDGDLLASTPDTPVALSQLGAVPQAYTGRLRLEPLEPGEYDLQVAVTDHLVRATLLKRAAFTVGPQEPAR